jgi:deoxyribonuclease V
MDEKELIKKYSLDIEQLKREQQRLSKSLQIKDEMNFSEISRIGAISNIVIQNQIISAIIICNEDYEIIEQQYFLDKLRFPYLRDFRSYREIPSMIEAYNKLNEKPDVMLINGPGIAQGTLGIASHFSVYTNIPTIGVSSELFEGNEIKNNNEIFLNEKKVGNILLSKEKSNPLYISPGNRISIESSLNVIKNMIKPPHKLPEPMHLANKYAKQVREELKL